MPQDAVITSQFAGLGADYCFTTFDRLALDLFAAWRGVLPGNYSTIIRSETEPAAADRDKVWVQVNADGAPTGRVFTYAYGKWVAPHPDEASGDKRMWWAGSESDLWSYGGGDGTDPSSSAPTATTGAMWERDTDYDFRFPLGAGTSATPTTVSIGDTGGEEDHVLTISEMPAHTHDGPKDEADSTSGGDRHATWLNNDMTVALPHYPTESTGGGLAHNNMPPYRVGIWAMRTFRIYFTP